MIGNTSAFQINSDQGLSYFNRSSNQSQFNVSPDGILDVNQIGTSKNPIKSVHSQTTSTGELSTKLFGAKTDDEYLRFAPDYATGGSGTQGDPYINGVKNAYADLPAEGGQIVVPAGVWCSEAGITIEKPVQIRGAGRGISIITAPSTLSGPVLDVAATDSGSTQREFATVKDITIDANNNGGDAINVSGNRHIFENVQIDDAGRHGITYSGVDNKFYNVYINNADIGFNATGGTTPRFYGGAIRYTDVGIRLGDGGGHPVISGVILEHCDKGAIQHYNDNNTLYENVHCEYNGETSGVSTVVGDSAATNRSEYNVTFKNCSWGANIVTDAIKISQAENVLFEQPLFGSAATNSINVDETCRKIRVRQPKDPIGVADPSNTITHENKVTIPDGADPTTTDYDVTRTFDGAIIDNGSRRWVVTDETSVNGAVAHLTPPPSTLIKATLTVDQSIPSSTPTKLQFGTEQFDQSGEYDTANYVFTADESGVYEIFGRITWHYTIPDGTRNIVYIYKNGSTVANNYVITGGSHSTSNSISTMLELDVGDTIEVYCWQNSGGAVNIDGSIRSNELNIQKLK